MGAELYRWVDENGVVNYSERPPEGVEIEKPDRRRRASSDTPELPAGVASTDAQSDLTSGTTELTEEQQTMLDGLRQAESERQDEIARIRVSNCSQARSTLERLQVNARVRVRDGDNERVMGEDERQQRIGDAQQGVAVNCDA